MERNELNALLYPTTTSKGIEMHLKHYQCPIPLNRDMDCNLVWKKVSDVYEGASIQYNNDDPSHEGTR